MLAQTIVTSSKKNNIPAKLYTAILMQESKYKLTAINSTTHDFGVAQINEKNIKNLKLDKVKLMTNMTYSIEAGAKILGSYRKFEKKEPLTWACRYNAGNRPLKVIKDRCMNYLAAVQPWF